MFPSRYNIQNLRKSVKSPAILSEEIIRINRNLNNRIFSYKSSQETNVIEQDWDTLIILDGCRYDVFEEHSRFDRSPQSIISQGSHSREFMQKTFSGKQLHDTIYITSNPWSEQLSEETFFLKRETYTEDDQSGKARLPGDVADLAIETFEEYPNKKYIIHFMQPNNPYVGPKSQNLREKLLNQKKILCTELSDATAEEYPELIDEIPNLRRALKKGYISRAEMLEVYIENLNIVTQYAKNVIEEIKGKTAVTADHGDLFGERLPPLFLKDYSHWEGAYSESLRLVPWLVLDSDPRREVISEHPIDQEAMGDSTVNEHLKRMGYLS
jgi:hypothetical protein